MAKIFKIIFILAISLVLTLFLYGKSVIFYYKVFFDAIDTECGPSTDCFGVAKEATCSGLTITHNNKNISGKIIENTNQWKFSDTEGGTFEIITKNGKRVKSNTLFQVNEAGEFTISIRKNDGLIPKLSIPAVVTLKDLSNQDTQICEFPINYYIY